MTTTDTQQVEAIDKINKIRRRALIDGYRSLTLKDGTASLALVQARADVLEILDLFDARAAVGGPRGDGERMAAMFTELYNCYTASKCAAAEKGEHDDYQHLKGMAEAYQDAAKRCQLFAATASSTPAERALQRLTEDRCGFCGGKTEHKPDCDHGVAPPESTRVEGEQWRQGMRDAAKEICDACADEYRYGRARKIGGSTRWWHGEHADFQCEAGSIWHALTESPIPATAPADNDAELFVLTVPEIEELIQGHESASVQLAQAGKDYGRHLRRLELLRRMLATTTKGDR